MKIVNETKKINTRETIRLRVIGAILAGIFLTMTAGIFTSVKIVNHFNHNYLKKELKMARVFYEQALVEDTETLKGVIALLAYDKKLQDLFMAGDRQGLFQQSEELFIKLRDQHRITYFYYHLPSRHNFLRIHKPDCYGDLIPRTTMKLAAEKGVTSAGIELGLLGTFTLRVVHPWVVEGQLIGYLELGEEIDHITRVVAGSMDNNLALVIDKTFLSEKKWLAGQQFLQRSGDWNLFADHVLIDTSFDTVPVPVLSYIRDSIENKSKSNTAAAENATW